MYVKLNTGDVVVGAFTADKSSDEFFVLINAFVTGPTFYSELAIFKENIAFYAPLRNRPDFMNLSRRYFAKVKQIKQ